MRKTLLLMTAAAALLAPATVNAQEVQEDFGRLEYVTYALGGGYLFNYQEGFNTLESVKEVFPGFENVTRKFFYNSRGLCTKEEAWQLRSNGAEVMSNYAEMEYNSKGQLTVRRGYNIAAWGELTHANTRDYTYDEEGRLTTLEVYLGDRSSIYETYAYLYDKEGRLELMDRSMPDDKTGKLLVNERNTYVYNDEGRLQTVINEQFYYDKKLTYEYSYDEYGNIDEVVQLNAEGTETGLDKYTYFYGIDNSEVIYPDIPSNAYLNTIRETGIQSVNPMETKSTFRYVEGYDPQLEDMITYGYEKADWSGVENVMADPIKAYGVMAFITGDRMRLDGVETGSDIRIFDLNGRKVMDCRYNGCVDLSGLASGVYTISTNNGATKFAY